MPEEGGEAAAAGYVYGSSLEGGIGPLALLADGTLWSPVRARRLPLLDQRPGRKVLGMAPAVPGMAVHGTGVRLLLDGGQVVTARMEPGLLSGLMVGGPWDQAEPPADVA